MVTANDPAVALASNSVTDAFRQYQHDPTKEHQQKLQAEKTHLEAAYDEAFEKELNQMISKVESADIRSTALGYFEPNKWNKWTQDCQERHTERKKH